MGKAEPPSMIPSLPLKGGSPSIDKERSLQKRLFLDTVLESFTQPFMVINARDFTVEKSNSAAGSCGEGEKKKCHELLYGQNHPCEGFDTPCLMEIIKKEKAPITIEHSFNKENEGTRYYEVHGFPVFDEKGEVESIIESSFDITERKQSEGEMKELAAFPSTNPNPILRVSREGCILYANDPGRAMLKLMGFNSRGNLPQEWLPHLEEMKRYSRSKEVEVSKGSRTFLLIFNLVKGEDYAYIYGLDITEKRAAEEQLRAASKVFEHCAEGMMITGPNGVIQKVNPAFTQITGYTSEEAVGWTPRFLKSNRQGRQFYQKMWRSLHDEGFWRGEIWNRRKNGEEFVEWQAISAIRDGSGEIIQYISIFYDFTEMKRQEEKVAYQARHDSLTKLPNRLLFDDRLSQAIKQARRRSNELAVLFLDLDNFKRINDSLGHPMGDSLLCEVARRLTGCLREEDTVSRRGGDEFIILLEDLKSEGYAMEAAERIRDTFSRPFYIKGHELFVTTSIGIALYPADGQDGETLIQNADMAMYCAKEKGKNLFYLFTPTLDRQAKRKLELEERLRRGVEKKEFGLYYQPVIDLHSGKISGFEALMRWLRFDLETVSPADFISVAEETGLIEPMTDMVLTQACRQMKEWEEAGGSPMELSVNISSSLFERKTLIQVVEKALSKSSLDPSRLCLEMTEKALLEHEEAAVSSIHALKALGLQLSIDHFGVGYSSLSVLKRLPIDELKIDRTFISHVPTDWDESVITKMIVSMAHIMETKVIAVGVENKEQLRFLRELRCDGVQGFLFSPPLPAEKLTRLILEKNEQYVWP